MLTKIYKRVIIVSLAIFFIASMARIFFKFNILDAGIGVAAGMLLSIIRFKLLSKSINQVVEMDKSMATKMGMIGYIGRYILTAAFMIAAVLYKLETFVALSATVVIATQIAARTIQIEDKKKGGEA